MILLHAVDGEEEMIMLYNMGINKFLDEGYQEALRDLGWMVRSYHFTKGFELGAADGIIEGRNWPDSITDEKEFYRE